MRSLPERRAVGLNYSGEIRAPFRFESPISLGSGVILYPDVHIGANSYVNGGMLHPKLHIGRFCSIAYGVTLGVGNHKPYRLTMNDFAAQMVTDRDYHNPYYKDNKWDQETNIDHDVWIGQNVIVVQGVTVGVGAIIAAGSVITKDVPPYAIVGGVPGKIIDYRFGGNMEWINALIASEWWNYRDEVLRNLPVNNPMRAIECLPPGDPSTLRDDSNLVLIDESWPRV